MSRPANWRSASRRLEPTLKGVPAGTSSGGANPARPVHGLSEPPCGGGPLSPLSDMNRGSGTAWMSLVPPIAHLDGVVPRHDPPSFRIRFWRR